jgi:hypothetical protein
VIALGVHGKLGDVPGKLSLASVMTADRALSLDPFELGGRF